MTHKYYCCWWSIKLMCPVGVVANPVLRNIALLKAAIQSGGGDTAGYAVDGHFNKTLCTTTSKMPNLWWSVDLKKQTIVTHVTVTSCGKDCVPTTSWNSYPIWSQRWKLILRKVSCCNKCFFCFFFVQQVHFQIGSHSSSEDNSDKIYRLILN